MRAEMGLMVVVLCGSSYAACGSPTDLSPGHTVGRTSDAISAEAKTIGTLELREKRVDILSAPRRRLFSVRDKTGQVLGAQLVEAEFAASFPDLYDTYRTARAGAFLDARVDCLPDRKAERDVPIDRLSDR